MTITPFSRAHALAVHGLLIALPLASTASAQESQGERSADSTLEEIVVRGTRPERYDAQTTSVGRFPQDLLEIPRTVNVVPEQVLLDQQV